MSNPLWQRSKGDEHLSEVREEDKKETEETETDGSMEAQTYPSLEGEIEKSGITVRMTRQDNDYGYFTLYCMNEERDWHQISIRCLKSKFKRMRI